MPPGIPAPPLNMSTPDAGLPLLEASGSRGRSAPSRRCTRSTSRFAEEGAGLVGDDEAGKSTLIRVSSGFTRSTRARSGSTGSTSSSTGRAMLPTSGSRSSIGPVALADNLDVVANMFLGRERVGNFRVLDESSMEGDCRKALDSLSVTTLRSVRQQVAGLSGGQRQAVAVAKSVMWDSKLVILDEYTAPRRRPDTAMLDLVRRLAEQGLGVVVISHNLHDIFEVSDGSRC